MSARRRRSNSGSRRTRLRLLQDVCPRLSPDRFHLVAFVWSQLLENGQGSRTRDNQSRKPGKVEEISFITRLSEMRASSGHGLKLDGTEAVWKMDGEDSDQKNDRHRNAGEGYECACEHCETTRKFDDDYQP